MNKKHRAILEHCKNGYTSLTSLLTKIPKSSLYVYREELLKEGYLSKKKAKYKTTQKGLAELSKSQGTGEVSSTQEQLTKQESKIEQKQAITLGLYNQIKEIIGDKGNVFDYNAKVMRLKDKLESIGISVDAIENFIQKHNELNNLGFTTEIAAALSKELQKTKLGVGGTVDKLSKCLAQYKNLEFGITLGTKKLNELQTKIRLAEEKISKLEGTIKNYGSTPQKIGELVELNATLRNAGITLQEAKEFARVHSELQKLGFNLKTTRILARELKNTNLGLDAAIKKIVQYAENFGSLEKAKQRWEQHKRESLAELKKINTEVSWRKEIVAKLKQEIQQLHNQKIELNNTLSSLNSTLESLRKEGKSLFDETANLLQTKKDVKAVKDAIDKFKAEKAGAEKELDKLSKELKAVSEKHQELALDVEITHAWREFLLSGKIPSYEISFWRDLEYLVKINKGEAQYLEPYKGSIAERVRKKLVEFYKKLVEKDLISVWSRWDVERLQKEVGELQEKMKGYVPKEKYDALIKEISELKKKQ